MRTDTVVPAAMVPTATASAVENLPARRVMTYRSVPGARGRFVAVGGGVREMFGLGREELLADDAFWESRLHPADRRAALAREESGLERGILISEYRFVRNDGRLVWVLDEATVVEDEVHGPVFDGVFVDVTSLRRSELKVAAHGRLVDRTSAGASLAEALDPLLRTALELCGAERCEVSFRSGLQVSAAAAAIDAAGMSPQDVTRTGLQGEEIRLRAVPSPETDDTLEWLEVMSLRAQKMLEDRARSLESAALLSATLESTVDGILVVDRHGRLAGWNEKWVQMWGVPAALLEAGDDAAVIAAVVAQVADPAAFLARVEYLYTATEETSYDEILFADGRVFQRYSRPQSVDGEIVGRVWSFRDITDGRKLQEALSSQQQRFQMLVEQVKDHAIIHLDRDGVVTTWNAGATQVFGYSSVEAVGLPVAVLHPEDGAESPEAILRRARTHGVARGEGWRVRKGGALVWMSSTVTALRDARGELQGYAKVTQDLTDRRAAAEALRAQRQVLELLGTVASAANSAPSVESAVHQTLRALRSFGGWDLAHAWLAPRADTPSEGDGATRGGAPGADPTHLWVAVDGLSSTRLRRDVEGSGILSLPVVAEAMRRGGPAWGEVATWENTSYTRAARALGLRTAMALPITVRDRTVGVVQVFSRADTRVDPGLVDVMAQVGVQLGRSVERHHAEDDLAAQASDLRDLSDRLSTVLDSVDEGIFGVDDRGVVTFVNRAGADLLRMPRSAVLGSLDTEVLHLDASPQGLPSGSRLPTSGRHERPDGTSFDAEWVVSPMQTGRGAVVILRDVEAARAVERMKDQFMAMASHELRTPLTSLRGALGLLGGGAVGELPGPASRLVDVATASADRLVRLVGDILDTERLRTGRIVLRHTEGVVEDLIASAVADTSAARGTVGVRVVAPDGPTWVRVDPDRVVQVIANLLVNAAKFSPSGAEVSVTVSRDDSWATVEVRDDGPGVPDGMQERIFDAFVQADASDTRAHSGSGLGLAIARDIVRLHGGELATRNRAQGGACFTFTLPLRGTEGAVRGRTA
ncbi:PAS domain S-box protein [Arthrobacter sp. NEB 688]|uniref:PAS domain S-box protein n=1 Tax=Arthrobacter sp. NEB 688 TaxID=904039 RepID=UPI001564D4C5|nr:PAS domain S-box protein [Arthrobacter sp. NEB 688]QKE85065.1 PAS domain S-box protein [Arthrobacter sp. NEB 688]